MMIYYLFSNNLSIKSFKGIWYTWVFSAIFDKGDNFCDFLFVFLHTYLF